MEVQYSIVDDIKIKPLSWFGHVERMPDNRLPKQILGWTPHCPRRRERPMLSWRDGINRAMRDRELGEESWLDRDQSRLGI